MEGGDHMEEEKTWKPSEGRRGEGGAMRDEGSMRRLSTAKETCGGIPSRSGQSGLCSRTSSEMNQFNKGTGQLFLCWTHSVESVRRNASVKNYLTPPPSKCVCVCVFAQPRIPVNGRYERH